MITATLRIPTHTGLPDRITAEVTENVEEAITSVTGLEIQVSVVEPSEEPYIPRPGMGRIPGPLRYTHIVSISQAGQTERKPRTAHNYRHIHSMPSGIREFKGRGSKMVKPRSAGIASQGFTGACLRLMLRRQVGV